MPEQNEKPFIAVALLNRDNQVIAHSENWQQLGGNNLSTAQVYQLQEFTAGVPGLADWVSAISTEENGAKRQFHSGNNNFNVQLLKLLSAQGIRMLLINGLQNSHTSADDDPYMRLRHDIKNRIGGLKLYATFLKRKLADQADLLDVVGKMISSLDQMTIEVNQIRKLEGDSK